MNLVGDGQSGRSKIQTENEKETENEKKKIPNWQNSFRKHRIKKSVKLPFAIRNSQKAIGKRQFFGSPQTL